MLVKDTTDRCGYKLFDFGTHWELQFKYGKFRGSLKQVAVYAVQQHEFEIKEIEIALEVMEETFSNGAEFGIFKKFMFPIDSHVTKVC